MEPSEAIELIKAAMKGRTSYEAAPEMAIANSPRPLKRFIRLYELIEPLTTHLYTPDFRSQLFIDRERIARGVLQYMLVTPEVKQRNGKWESESTSRHTGSRYHVIIDLTEWPYKIGCLSEDADYRYQFTASKHVIAVLIKVLIDKGILEV